MPRTGPTTGARPDPSARDRILAAAEELFAENGFDRTSTARLAARADVPQGLIFYHFSTKIGILLTLVRDRSRAALEEMLPPPAEAGRGGTPDLVDVVRGLWQRMYAELGTPSPTRRIVFQELTSHPEIRARAQELQDEIADAVTQYLARATGHGDAALPEHVAAARLLTVTASFDSLVSDSAEPHVDADALARVIAAGLSRLPAP